MDVCLCPQNIKELCALWLFAADRADQEWTEDQEDEAVRACNALHHALRWRAA